MFPPVGGGGGGGGGGGKPFVYPAIVSSMTATPPTVSLLDSPTVTLKTVRHVCDCGGDDEMGFRQRCTVALLMSSFNNTDFPCTVSL